MTIRHERDALAKGLINVQDAEKTSGGHSWGYAFVEDGEFTVEHGIGEIPAMFKIPVTDNALVHTRMATQGEINITNAHPFEITDEDDNVVAMLAHNGTWHGSPDHDLYSDTWFMARALESYVRDEPDFETALELLTDHVGETVVVLHESGSAYVYSGRFEITREGSVVQSSGLESIKTGRIERIDPDGSVTAISESAGRNHKITRYITK